MKYAENFLGGGDAIQYKERSEIFRRTQTSANYRLERPSFVFTLPAHWPELWKSYAGTDPIGYGDRVYIVFGRPEFNEFSVVQAKAAELIAYAREIGYHEEMLEPAELIAHVMKPILDGHQKATCAPAVKARLLRDGLRYYKPSLGCLQVIGDRFDIHVS